MTKHVSLQDFLTEDEIGEAIRLRIAPKILKQIIAPNLDRINKALGQENDARYLAYVVEYIVYQLITPDDDAPHH